MPNVIKVQGTGGAVFEIDDPRDGVTNRDEVLRNQLAKGDLIIVEYDPKPAAKKATPKPADD